MSRRIVEYLPFLGIVLMICTASWLAGRSLPAPRGRADKIGRDVFGGAAQPDSREGRTISK
jgi:hypothetical protein